MSTLRRWSTRTALALGGTLVGLLLVELGVRQLSPSSGQHLQFSAPVNTPSGLYMNDQKVVFRPTPGFQGTMKTPGYEVELRVNSVGLRGPEVQTDERPVWLALGDSFTFAAQVPEEQSFVSLLGEDLGVQVLNAGSDGHGTQHELARFRQLERPFSPEVVLLVFFTGNDFQNNVNWRSALAGARKKPDQLVQTRDPVSPILVFLNQNSLVWGMLRMLGRSSAAGKEANEMDAWRRELSIFHLTGKEPLQQGIDATRTPLQVLRDRVARRGGQLMVAVASPAFAIEDHRTAATFELVDLSLADQDLTAPERATLALLQELDIPACPLDPALRQAHADGERSYLAHDAHWSALGHQVVAETIGACLREQGLAPQP